MESCPVWRDDWRDVRCERCARGLAPLVGLGARLARPVVSRPLERESLGLTPVPVARCAAAYSLNCLSEMKVSTHTLSQRSFSAYSSVFDSRIAFCGRARARPLAPEPELALASMYVR